MAYVLEVVESKSMFKKKYWWRLLALHFWTCEPNPCETDPCSGISTWINPWNILMALGLTACKRAEQSKINVSPHSYHSYHSELNPIPNHDKALTFYSWEFIIVHVHVTALIILPWTPKICLECLLCFNQSQARSSHHRNHKQRMVSHRSRNKLFSFCSRIQSLVIFFCTTRGLDLCGVMIEPSNYCAGRNSFIARSQTGKTADQIQHLWNDWHIAKSNQLNFRYSVQNIILLFLWRHLCIWCLGDYILQ